MAEVSIDPEQQRVFYGLVREFVISLILGICFYTVSYTIVSYFRRNRDRDDPIIREDTAVYMITTMLCSIAVTVSLGAMVLLPSSIISNEIRHLYPHTYYVKWLNTSLITDLWNLIFLGSNLCLFLLLPFAYFFYEAEGLPETKKGVMSRVYEAVIILLLVAALVIGTVWVADALTLHLNTSEENIMDFHGLLSYVSFLYSCMSMLGVLFTSLCTPVGFAHVFTVLGQIIVQPELHVDVEQELESLEMEKAVINRHLKGTENISPQIPDNKELSLEEINQEIKRLERHHHSSICERHFLFPVSFLFVLALTCVSLLLVSFNILNLLFSSEKLPKGAQDHIYILGEMSSSYMGPIGALVEIILIVYMITASLVGFYSTPVIGRFVPVPHETSMLKIILNSIILLTLSSAMPVMVKALGITKFNLMGHFSSLAVLQSFWLVLSYNLTFFILTCSIIFKRATQSIIREVTYLLRDRIKFINSSAFHKTKSKVHLD